jgi:hypothetical protein
MGRVAAAEGGDFARFAAFPTYSPGCYKRVTGSIHRYYGAAGMRRGLTMNVRQAMFIAVLGLAAASGSAWAQVSPGAGQEPPPCLKKFIALRANAEAKAKKLEAAGKRKQKPTAQEACGLFNAFSAAESKLLAYAKENGTWCGIPPRVVTQMEKAHQRIAATRTRICRAAAAQRARPRGPTLSDALGASAPNANNVRTGRGGTFDTLTGSALGKQ